MSQQAFGSFRNSFIVREALRVAPGRPNFAAGLRAGLATTVPLLLIPILERPELAWASIAGFSVVLSDKGGAYRTRANTMLALCLSGGLSVLLGTLGGAHPVISMLLVLLVVGISSFVRLFGAEATGVGITTAMALVLALDRPVGTLGEALTAAGFFVAGGLWAAVLSLVLWPLRVYRPARFAVGNSLRALARVADAFVDASTEAPAQVARRERLGVARQAIELARAALGRSRRSRPGPTRRGEQLVALLEATDLLFGTLVALEDGLALEPPDALPDLPDWLEAAALRVSSQLVSLADALEDERPLSLAPTVAEAGAQLRSVIAPHAEAPSQHVPRILLRALERLDRVLELGRAIDDPSAQVGPSPIEPVELSSDASMRSLLRDHLTLRSAMFRHALRTAISTAVVVLATHALALEHGYWATLTCVVILQPHGAATWAKALQRVLGTIVGAGLAMVIASYVHGPFVVAAVFVFVALGMAVLPLNYGAFAVFLTPGFVLLAETHAGNLDLASVRVINTLFGAFVALLGSRLLFPLSERDAFRPLMGRALAQLRGLLKVAASERPQPARLRDARRRLGLALLNAEASYQRMLTETALDAAESQAILTLLLYAHRLASGLIALAEAEGTSAHQRLVTDCPGLARALEDLTRVVAERRLPRVVAERAAPPSEPGGERVDRLFEQIAVLRTAAVRWNGEGAAA